METSSLVTGNSPERGAVISVKQHSDKKGYDKELINEKWNYVIMRND